MESSGGASPACLPGSHVSYLCLPRGRPRRAGLAILSPPLGLACACTQGWGLGEGRTDKRADARPLKALHRARLRLPDGGRRSLAAVWSRYNVGAQRANTHSARA